MTMDLNQRIQTIIEDRDKRRWPFAKAVLHGLSMVYGGLVNRRLHLYQTGRLSSHQLPCTVISVGNLTTGGTGKTPMVCAIATFFQKKGKRVVVMSRGYKGGSEKKGGLVSDTQQMLLNATDAGDEPYLMAHRMPGIPVLVGQNRLQSGRLAIQKFAPDVIVLDDGFQHLRLKRHVNLLLLDAQHPFDNGYLLPRGKLREPASHVSRADAIILTRSNAQIPQYYDQLCQSVRPKPVFRAFHMAAIRGGVPAGKPIQSCGLTAQTMKTVPILRQKRVFAFSGLANNASFIDSVRSLDGIVVKNMEFQDHHNYTIEEINEISHEACRYKSHCIATSEKDYMRIPKGMTLPLDLIVIGVDIDFKAEQVHWEAYLTDAGEFN